MSSQKPHAVTSPLLQGRLFSYPDTQRHRLGPNYALIPVNCPHARTINNYRRDGLMRVDANGGGAANYEPNSYRGPRELPSAREAAIPLAGVATRRDYPRRDVDLEQAGLLYAVLKEDERTRLVGNLAGHMRGVERDIQVRQIAHFLGAHEKYGTRVAEALGIPVAEIRAALAGA